MNVDKKELKEQEIRSLFISPALNAKGWNVSKNMREELPHLSQWQLHCSVEAKEMSGNTLNYIIKLARGKLEEGIQQTELANRSNK